MGNDPKRKKADKPANDKAERTVLPMVAVPYRRSCRFARLTDFAVLGFHKTSAANFCSLRYANFHKFKNGAAL